MADNDLKTFVRFKLICCECTNFVETTIYQCETGHNFCGPCFNKITLCPKCMCRRGTGRNLALERLSTKITYLCGKNKEGCNFEGNRSEIMNHFNDCDYSPKVCPLRFLNGCKWDGKYKDLESHCKEHHAKRTISRSPFVVIVDLEGICIWYLEREGNSRFVLTHIGEASRNRKFTYVVLMLNGCTNKPFHTFSKPCIHQHEMRKSFPLTDDLVSLPTEMLKGNCDEKGQLKLVIRVCMENIPGEIISLERSIIEEVKCQNCSGFMIPFIPQCETGHSSCEKCFEKLKKCPQCEAPKSSSRNLTLEELAKNLQYTCKYAYFGCDYRGNGSELVKHYINCIHGPRLCPVRYTQRCSWRGPVDQIGEHCLLNHNRKLSLASKIKFFLRRFNDQNFREKYVKMFFVNERVFRFSGRFDKRMTLVQLGCVYFGAALKNVHFTYKISILKGNTTNVAQRFQGSCIHVTEDNVLFSRPWFISLPYARWMKWCNGHGDLYFTLEILDE